jgi:hypothetical protein
MKNLLLILFLLLIENFGFSQVVGVQGQRCFLEYDFSIMPAIKGINTKGESAFEDGWIMSSRNQIKAGYVLTNQLAGSFSFDFFRTGIDMPKIFDESKKQISGGLRSISGFSTGIGLDYYPESWGSLSPTGIYIHSDLRFISMDTRKELGNRTLFTYTGIGMGKRFSVGEKVVINMFFQTGYVWDKIGKSFENSIQNDISLRTVETTLERTRNHYLFEGGIGLGILLF